MYACRNVIGGMFRLQFEGQVTSSLNFDAGANDVRLAMEGLSTVGTVVVTRTGPSYQNGYAWTITFNDPMNAGQSMTHPHPTIEHNTTQCTILMTYPIVISTLSNHPHTLSITPIIPPPPHPVISSHQATCQRSSPSTLV